MKQHTGKSSPYGTIFSTPMRSENELLQLRAYEIDLTNTQEIFFGVIMEISSPENYALMKKWRHLFSHSPRSQASRRRPVDDVENGNFASFSFEKEISQLSLILKLLHQQITLSFGCFAKSLSVCSLYAQKKKKFMIIFGENIVKLRENQLRRLQIFVESFNGLIRRFQKYPFKPLKKTDDFFQFSSPRTNQENVFRQRKKLPTRSINVLLSLVSPTGCSNE